MCALKTKKLIFCISKVNTNDHKNFLIPDQSRRVGFKTPYLVAAFTTYQSIQSIVVFPPCQMEFSRFQIDLERTLN